MLYSKLNDLEDKVVELAAGGKTTVKSLHGRLDAEGGLSLRAVYKTVHKLISAGVLLKVEKQVILDHEWVKRVGERLGSVSAPLLSNGERAAYTFASVEHLDAFWKTVVLPLERASPAREIFFYNPHNFWAYLPARKESEDAYYRHFSGSEHYGFFTVGGDSRADMEFKREYQSEHLQIDLRNIGFFRRTDHVTIVDPFVITVRLSKKTSGRIDKLYSSGRSLKDILPDIVSICQKPGKIRFVLENNQTKVKRFKKMLAKNFYFKRTE